MAKKTARTAKKKSPAKRPKGAAKSSPAKTQTSSKRRNGRPRGTAKQRLENLAKSIVEQADRHKDPAIAIPTRSLSNVIYNEKTRHVEMGDNKQSRNFFNYGQAKRFMQTMLVASKCKELIERGKTASIRQIYYMSKHTIKGTNEKTFDDQSESDPIIEDLEVAVNALREELHVFADSRGAMIGEITIIDAGDTIDCTRMGTGGYAVPSIVEPDVIQFKECKAKFILHVEKAAVWQRFNEDKFWKKHNCILTHGGGQPPRGVRRMLFRLHHELKLPVYCLLDNDPWGYYIYSVIKQGSINLAYESKRMAVPNAKFLGIRSKDFDRCDLSSSVTIKLSDNDKKRAKQIAQYPWFEHKKAWQKEIGLMLKNDFKLEVEALISKDISYVTEEYTPARLKNKDWLD